jgi:hypothetical protein
VARLRAVPVWVGKAGVALLRTVLAVAVPAAVLPAAVPVRRAEKAVHKAHPRISEPARGRAATFAPPLFRTAGRSDLNPFRLRDETNPLLLLLLLLLLSRKKE